MNNRLALWNIAFSLFFILLLLIGIQWLFATNRFTPYVPLADFLLMALAIFRLIRLFSYDLITKFYRDWLAKQPEDSFLGTLSALMHCPWCSGLWFSYAVVFFYFATPISIPLILILALAGVASIIQILANLIGWSAEYKKRIVTGSQDGGITKGGGTCG